MIITKSAMDIIHGSVTDLPPETGGLLGSSDGMCVDTIVMDRYGTQNVKLCSYCPNVTFFNQCIRQWQDQNIIFMGIFHTHFVGVRTLSSGDREYINAIMSAMPEQIDVLYFPLYVLPDRQLVCYKAKRTDKGICIEQEDVMIE